MGVTESKLGVRAGAERYPKGGKGKSQGCRGLELPGAVEETRGGGRNNRNHETARTGQEATVAGGGCCKEGQSSLHGLTLEKDTGEDKAPQSE